MFSNITLSRISCCIKIARLENAWATFEAMNLLISEVREEVVGWEIIRSKMQNYVKLEVCDISRRFPPKNFSQFQIMSCNEAEHFKQALSEPSVRKTFLIDSVKQTRNMIPSRWVHKVQTCGVQWDQKSGLLRPMSYLRVHSREQRISRTNLPICLSDHKKRKE